MIETNKSTGNYIKNQHHSSASTIQYEWIEKLLGTSIEDGRKYALWKIFCPYLVNVKKLEYEQSFEILKTWLEKCNNLKNLNFDIDTKVKDNLKNVKHYHPISIKTFMHDNKDLYLLLKIKISTLT